MSGSRRGMWLVCLAALGAFTTAAHAADAPRIKVLFLGDNGHHKPADRAADLTPAMQRVGIDVTYTDQVASLAAEKLGHYDCLILYANHNVLPAAEEAALVEFVERGGGFVPIHCASACFGNSAKFVALVGGRFKQHGTGVFRPVVVQPQHPVMQGFHDFEAWDESYVHANLTSDRETLMERVDGKTREPWTWVRTQGKGRVFYTASGHDERVWRNPGFLNLIERGIRWSVGRDPASAGTARDPLALEPRPMTPARKDVEPFKYVPAKVAFYPPGGARTGGGDWNQMQLPLAPAESQKHLRVPQGFRAELFAAEPEIGKPICMNWDERGRLWVAETVDYPNELQPEGEGRDRIRICEDTDHDGRADKFTVFAEKLSIPTSLAFARGGVIVHQAPHTLFLKDTNGDDVCDERQVLFSGWSTGDTHAGPSNLTYGFDNWMYGIVGYAGFEGTVGGEKLSFKQGFYRFRPDGSKLEFLRSTDNNSWGIGFSEDGLLFGSTANHNPSVYLPIPNRYYERVRGWSSSQLATIADTYMFHAPEGKIRQVDHHGGYTAAAGHALYTARSYPQDYWNRTAFVAEPTGHLVGTFVLARDGAKMHSTNPGNLLESDDEWTAPIMAEVGPDGSVWVIDWYNYIVQHNPTPIGFERGKGNAYETDLRDKKHGRVYRIVYGDGAQQEVLNLRGATPEQLVAALKNPNLLWRRHAQRLLVERGQSDVVGGLFALIQDAGVDEIGLNVGAMHALWTMQGLGALDSEDSAATKAAQAALRHASPGVRSAAVAVLPRSAQLAEAIKSAGLLQDADAQVRLATLLALAETPADQPLAGEMIAASLQDASNLQDRWLSDAMTSAAAAHDAHFLHEVLARRDAPLAAKAQPIVSIVAEHYARGGPAKTLSLLLATLPTADPGAAEAIVAGLAKGWPKNVRAELNSQTEAAIASAFESLPSATQGQLVSLTQRIGSQALSAKSQAIADALANDLANATLGDEARAAAARQLLQFRPQDQATARSVLNQVTARTSAEFSTRLLEALAASEAAEVGSLVLERMPELTPTSRAAAIRLLLTRAAWTQALIEGLDAGRAQLSDLSLDQKQSLAAHPDKKLAAKAQEIFKRGGVLPNADRQRVLAELMPLTQQIGDIAAGKAVFLKQCSKCHTHSGVGAKVGPDLTGMAVHPKAELLTHILDPSRSVEGNFRAYTVVTDEGQVFNGLLASESKTAIEIFDAEGKRHTLQRDSIEQLVASNKSVMPEGFEKQVPAGDIVNLLEFLTAKGRYFPLPLGKVANSVTTKSMFFATPNGNDRIVFDDWSPKTFAGVPFQLIDPRGETLPNAIMLNGPQGKVAPTMPKSVSVACNAKARAIHLLSGVSGWGFPFGRKGEVSMIVRFHYDDGKTEDLPLLNGEHFADYIRRVDVPGSQLAFMVHGHQVRYLAVLPQRDAVIREVEFVKGPDGSAPIVMAATVESR